MQQQIIAIGGGGFAAADSQFLFERYLLEVVKSKDAPRVCFLPQASNENREYVTKFYEAFIHLGARPSWLSLFGKVKAGWEEQLLANDLIYVGGGNTKSMLALWQAWGVDRVLKQALEQGTVLAGVSAGAICWFEQALTDSVWPLGIVPGLGWLPGSACPHYDGEKERRPAFVAMLAQHQIKPGIAIEDQVAVHYVNGAIKQVIATVPGKKAYVVDASRHRELLAQTLPGGEV
jgi:peptidase E